MKYCYSDTACKGFLLDSMLGVVTYEGCCQNGGSGWGLFHDECMACSDVALAVDGELVTGLDTPVGE